MSRTAEAAAAVSGAPAPTSSQSKAPATVEDMLRNQGWLSRLAAAAPQKIDSKHLQQVALTEVRRNPALQRCNPLSVFGAMIHATTLGLDIGSTLGQCYLVPYKDEAQFIIGYRGMIELCRRSGEVTRLSAHEVYAGDTFSYELGLETSVRHRPTMSAEHRGEVVAYYAMAKMKSGELQVEVMLKEDIDKIRDASPGKNSGPWKDHYNEMAKKTVIRKLFKYLPVSLIQQAVKIDEDGSYGLQQNTTWAEVEPEKIIDPAA